MKRNMTLILAVLLAGGLLAGCSKSVDLTVMNHTGSSNEISVTCPTTGTMPVGTVGPGGSLSYKVSVPNDDLPARCTLSAGPGISQAFTITPSTPGAYWFHITKAGSLAGPYGKDDVHTETNPTEEVNLRVDNGMVVR